MPLVVLIVCVALSVFGHDANADYTLTPLSAGQGTLAVSPGSSFTLDMVMTSDGSDEHTVAEFDVVFSQPGLTLHSYAWGGSHAASGFDNSDPALNLLPVVLDEDTRGGPGSPVDIHFDNFTTTPFTSGTVVSMDLTVPHGFDHDLVTIDVTVIAVEGDNGPVTSVAGPGLALHVPEPSSMALIMMFGLTALAGRRRNRTT